MKTQTQVIIIGAGPSGLLLSLLLHKAGIETIIIERQSPEHVLGRIRAGVLEQVCIHVMDELDLGERLHQEGLLHSGFDVLFEGKRHRIDLHHWTQGQHVMVYGQTELTRDMMQRRQSLGLTSYYEAEQVMVHDFDTKQPRVTWKQGGISHEVKADFIAGCDGFHGVCRASVPRHALQEFEKVYPFGWLGLLADTPPVHHELIYVNSDRGFALCSQRSTKRSRYYLQIPLTSQLNEWTDEAFWQELKLRLDPEAAAHLVTGPSIEKSIAPLRSFVTEPMRFGRMFLAGDAAHIVPPTGAKGLNLAVTDVKYLAQAITTYYHDHTEHGLDNYSNRCLARIWRAERFSWWFTSLMHQFPEDSPITRKLQMAELSYLIHSPAALTTLAENYVGLPMNFGE